MVSEGKTQNEIAESIEPNDDNTEFTIKLKETNFSDGSPVTVTSPKGGEYTLDHGMVAIASITSCTNTSNPSVMVGAHTAKQCTLRLPLLSSSLCG